MASTARTSTSRILADKALMHACGQECVDWAVAMLKAGRGGRYMAILAGMEAPHNHFELASLRDRALAEAGLTASPPGNAVGVYAAELLREALDGDGDLAQPLRELKDLCLAHDYRDDLYDFYLLYFACTDLQEDRVDFPRYRGHQDKP